MASRVKRLECGWDDEEWLAVYGKEQRGAWNAWTWNGGWLKWFGIFKPKGNRPRIGRVVIGGAR